MATLVANIVEPDEMPHNAAFHQSLHCLPLDIIHLLRKKTHARIQELSSGGGGGGGPGQSHKKSSDVVVVVFFFFFLVLSLFYRSQMVNFKENYHFSRFQRGSNIFQGGGGGGPTFSRGGGGV